ncbi:MAG: hypothetical protein AMXMBFR34_17130 [Myxococcaceae bacterium]
MLALVTILSLAAAPEVALLDSAGDTTRLRFQPVGSSTLAPVAASLVHGDGSTVLGALLPGRRVVVATAVVGRARDESFAAGCFRLEPSAPSRMLVDRVVPSTRPVVLESGRVFVQRGRPGEETPLGRVDALSIDEVNPDTGKARTVYEARGFTTFLAGALGRELIVYEVGLSGARLLAVHVDALSVRTLVPALPPLAFDFSVDAARRRVVFTLGEPGVERWQVVAVDVPSGAMTALAEGPTVALVPAVLPDGRVVYARGEGQGLFVAGSDARALAPQGKGFERLRAVVKGVGVGLHEVPSGFPRLFTVTLGDARVYGTAFPAQARLDIAGVTP